MIKLYEEIVLIFCLLNFLGELLFDLKFWFEYLIIWEKKEEDKFGNYKVWIY